MSTRYFRSNRSVYESVRAQLNQAWGYPNAQTKTETAIPHADDSPTDSAGRVYLAVSAAYCDFILPGQMLPDLLASGAVEELTKAKYLAAMPPAP